MTAVGRTTASRLKAGDRILVEPYDRREQSVVAVTSYRSTTRKLTGKSDVVAATIVAVQVHQISSGRRSTTYRTFVLSIDGGGTGKVANNPPSQTFALAPPAASNL